MFDFSDWGAADWTENLVAAEAKARNDLSTVATAKAWPASATAAVEAIIAREVAASKGYFSDDVAGFWQRIGAAMAAATGPLPTNWAKLANAYHSGSMATESVATGRAAGNVSTVVLGTVEGTAEDIAKGVDPRRSLLPWFALATVLGIGYAMRGKK